MYFYTYPKGSPLYSQDELIVINAILYNEHTENIEKAAKKVLSKNSNAIDFAFNKLGKLELDLPCLLYTALHQASIFQNQCHKPQKILCSELRRASMWGNLMKDFFLM